MTSCGLIFYILIVTYKNFKFADAPEKVLRGGRLILVPWWLREPKKLTLLF
jgi:hypothetical protein